MFELDQFFPPADRMGLAIKLNGLLASPSFAAWADGPPLDIGALLRSTDGKPAAAIVTIAHLSDEERQFVVALVLSKLVTWMRQQSGTTDLRTLLYMDEVMGYVPPTAAPPTKKPIMTLMKQARAFGVGVVLSTQNPVDIDYKAISNAGTWVVGRLQTERDKGRLLDGMSAAAGGVDVKAVGDTISGLAKREFVLRRAGKDSPEVFTSRWAMSYLRGPLTRDQIAMLMADARTAVGAGPPAAAPVLPPNPPAADDATPMMPEVAEGVGVYWVDAAAPWLGAVGGAAGNGRYAAAAVARVRLRYDEERADLVVDDEYEAVLHPLTATADPAAAIAVDYDERDLLAAPPGPVTFVLPGARIKTKSFWTTLERDLVSHLARARTLEIFANRPLKLYSRAGETSETFAARCKEAGAAKADEEAARLRDKYETKVRGLQDKLQAAQDRADVLAAEAQGREHEEVLSTAGSILGSFLGGRRSSSSLANDLRSAAGRRSRSRAASERLGAAQNKMEAITAQLTDLESDLADDVLRIERGVGRQGVRHRLGASQPGEDRHPGGPAGPRLGARELSGPRPRDRPGHLGHEGAGGRRRGHRRRRGRGAGEDGERAGWCSRGGPRRAVAQRRGGRRGGHVRHRWRRRWGGSGQPGRDDPRVGPRRRSAALDGDRLAGPAVRCDLPAAGRDRGG